MYWNHRRVQDVDGKVTVSEVYYDDDDQPYGWCDATWTDFLRRPSWLWRALRSRALRYPEDFVTSEKYRLDIE